MARRPVFWLVFGALGIGGAVVAVSLFSAALPSISIDIRMDRQAAVDSARSLAVRYGWGSADDRSAPSFGLADAAVQTFVELEGGGREVFERLAAEGVYQPHQWRVRRFAEGRVEESLVRFTPQGVPYGFRLTLPEDDPGDGNLSRAAAQLVAEPTAAEWGVDLASYQLAESSQETQPGGRIDHVFVYERADERLGAGRFRLRIGVAGGRPSQLTHFVSVPEAFERRYAEMRSTNDTIALVAQGFLFLAFILVGAGVGSALLLRERWLVWRAPLAWGAVISALLGAGIVNQLPLSWTAYDTALSSTTFVVQQLGGGAAIAVIGAPLIAFFLMAGESLGRRAFPEHLQQWRFWSPEVAASKTALGMTVAAYLLVGLQVGYVVLFYLGTQRLDGWWSPADALVQPDLLATYLPWLEAVSLALFAAFWEESVFRAVPIACAALLGTRFGRRGLWIWGAVVLQALVFAAGHANYPQQPPYARVIELMAPALLWGVVYLRYGLVPTILAHFLYDLSLISIVLFESRALVDQGVIVAVGLLPLAVVLGARWRHGARDRAPAWAFNGVWEPRVPRAEKAVADESEPVVEDAAAEVGVGAEPVATLPRRLPAWSARLGLAVGLVLVLATLSVRSPAPRLWGDRDGAVDRADAALATSGVQLERWSRLVSTSSGTTQGSSYVFDEAGHEAWVGLVGRYFGEPRWIVRYVDWQAEPEDRAEEYVVWVGGQGRVGRVSHTLPEARPGASLSMQAARALALEAVANRFDSTAEELEEVEAAETRRPNRTDWLFTFTEAGLLEEVEGEARLQVRVAGDEVVDVAPTIHVPEEWERTRRRVQTRATIMRGGLRLLLLLAFGAATVAAVVVWSRRRLPTDVGWKLAALSFAALTVSTANDWPATTAGFSTTQPWTLQAGATALALMLLVAVVAPAVGLVGALAHGWLREAPSSLAPRYAGVAFGLLAGGLALVAPVVPARPTFASYFAAASFLPELGPAGTLIPVQLILTSAVLVTVALYLRFRDKAFVGTTVWSLAVAVAVVAVPVELQASLVAWAVGALLIAAALLAGLAVCTLHPLAVPTLVGTLVAVQAVWISVSAPYAGARIGGLIALALSTALAWWWTRELGRSTVRGEPSVVPRTE